MKKLIYLAGAVLLSIPSFGQMWIPNLGNPVATEVRPGRLALSSSSLHFGIGLFESTQSSIGWSGYFKNGHGDAHALRVKGGWYNGAFAPIFQVEANNFSGGHTVGNVRMVVMANGNTGLGTASPNWRFHVKDVTPSDAGNTDDYIGFIEGEPKIAGLRVWTSTGTTSYFQQNKCAIVGENMTGEYAIGINGIGRNIGVLGEGIGIDETVLSVGVHGVAGVAEDNYGVYGFGGCNDGKDGVGVYGYSFGPSGQAIYNAYGVYGKVNGSGGGWYAGYFEGDLAYTGTLINASDARLKKNIKEFDSVLDRIMELRPSTYEFNSENELGKITLAEGTSFGFIAQEMEEVFPELVEEVVHPAQYDEKGNKTQEPINYKGINYNELIPVLTKAIQEQQQQINSLKGELNELVEANDSPEKLSFVSSDVENSNDFLIYPNPTSGEFEILLILDQEVEQFTYKIVDQQGATLLESELENTGLNQVQVNQQLNSGVYFVSVLVEGTVIDTKRIIVR